MSTCTATARCPICLREFTGSDQEAADLALANHLLDQAIVEQRKVKT